MREMKKGVVEVPYVSYNIKMNEFNSMYLA